MPNLNLENSYKVCVYDGLAHSSLLSVVGHLAPYSKIAIFFEENFECTLQVQALNALKKAGCKVVLIGIEKNKLLSIDRVCGIFNLHEDIRLVISLGQTHAFAKYFATIRNLPTVFLENELNCQLFSNSFYLYNGNYIDAFHCDCQKIYLINKTNVNCKRTLQEFVFNAKMNLFNGYVKMLFISSEYNAKSHLEILAHLDEAEKILTLNNELSTQNLSQFFSCVCKAFYFDELQGRKFLCLSHLSVIEILSNKNLTNQQQFFINSHLLSTFKKAYTREIGEIVNYNDFAQKICKLYQLDLSLILNTMTDNLKNVDNFTKEKTVYLEKALIDMQKYYLAVRKRYAEQGGKINKLSASDKESVKNGGFILNFNLLTLIPELPFIKKKNL